MSLPKGSHTLGACGTMPCGASLAGDWERGGTSRRTADFFCLAALARRDDKAF